MNKWLIRFDLTVCTLRKLFHTDSLLVIRSSQAAQTQKRLFENKPRPKEFGESFDLMTALQPGTQGKTTFPLSVCEPSTSFHTQRLSVVAGMIKRDLLSILYPPLLLRQSHVRSTTESGESWRDCQPCQR
ncbi:Isoflavone reductase [Dissostichus eleginoides]|uniref:Isoflavone reductase n=1 Tax=Dissostichus eleginoides TaxID=100907 RepID=A0AAD9B6J1_DISEL|nr:Isoflavone reductase [Dissostichus eleginoides]